MKVVSAHQPAYLPWLGYFHKILLCDEFVIMDDVQFEKNSYINRNRILHKGEPFWLTIPVATKGYKEKTIRDMRVVENRWQDKHLKSIDQTYGKSRYYSDIMPIIERTLSQKSLFLIDYTNSLLLAILSYLEIRTPVRLASDLDIADRKLGYVISLTKKLDGTHFVFGKLGRSYADLSLLRQSDIKAHFQDYKHPTYPQLQKPFVPCMAVIDALFNMGKEVKSLVLEGNRGRSDLGK